MGDFPDCLTVGSHIADTEERAKPLASEFRVHLG